eukprot:375782_1
MSFQPTDESQAEGDPLYLLLSENCLKTSDHVTEVKNAFDNEGIDYDTLLQLTEADLIETFKDIGIKTWHRRLIINKLKTIPESAINKPVITSPTSVVILTPEQNQFLINLHTNGECAKTNAIKLEELEAEIEENAKKLTYEINERYTELINILTKQKEIALQKVEATKTRKLNIIKKQYTDANDAVQFLSDTDTKFNQIINDNKLDRTKKQIALTQHIKSSQQQLMKHKQYYEKHIVFATQSQLKYKKKDKKIFEQFVSGMDQILDADINFTKIKFKNDMIIINWKSELANVSENVKFELQFKQVKREKEDNKEDEKEAEQWNVLKLLQTNQKKIYLFGGNDETKEEKKEDDSKDEDMKDDAKDEEIDMDQDEIEFYSDDDSEQGDDIDKGKAGLLVGRTRYAFRIAVTISDNILYSNVLIAKTPRFNRIESSIISSTEQAQLMGWIPDSNVCTFELLFRGTRDGFSLSAFHEKCDGKGPNVVIIQSNHNHVFGGYAETGWDGSVKNYQYDDNAWLYLLRSGKGDKPKVFKIKNKKNAIYSNSGYGPTYGNHDLYICDNSHTANNSYAKFGPAYEASANDNQIGGAAKFQVIDYEVWQVSVPRFSEMQSNILKPKEFAKLNEWLQEAGKTQYRLLLRGSTDGFTASVFHAKCDNQGVTLAIIQSASNHVFGGYTEKSWVHTGTYERDDNAWIYLLRSSKGDEPQKWTPTKKPQYAIYKNNDRCCCFGGGHDIGITDQCNENTSSYSNFGHSYSADNDQSKLAGSYNFKVTEYEIWNVF